MVKVVAKNFAKADKIDEFVALAIKLVAETNKNDIGCIHYELFQDANNPQVLTIIEEWESMEALNQHMVSRHFKELAPQMDSFTAAPVEISLLNKLA